MASGGARNRSGPAADPQSGRSERRGFKLTALPAEGFRGKVPEFPLPAATDRELEIWDAAWRTPQACAWSQLSESWRVRPVARWCRMSARCEDPEAPASLIAQLHRFADQIGMTSAGLAQMGWRVASDELAEHAAKVISPANVPIVRRMRATGGGA